MPPLSSRNSVDAVAQYLKTLRTTHDLHAHAPEVSFYPALTNLFNAVGETLTPRVFYQPHPSIQGTRNLPDGGLYVLPGRRNAEPTPGQRPERGVVEIKPPADSLATLARSPQVRAYLADFGLCLITNYRQFQLLDAGNGDPRVLESYDLVPTEADLWTAPFAELVSKHKTTLPDFLARAFTRRVPLEKPKDLAWLLASYAREARARAEMHPLAAFAAVKSALQESLGITFEGDKGEHFFLSTLIQTLFYGIFSAWILWRGTPEGKVQGATFNWRLSADYLRIPVLRQLFHAISERGALNTVQIIEVLDDATEALNRVQPGFFRTFNEADAVNYFYEPFLEAFDPELRKQFGVWYTPREIVRYMVERVDHLLRTELNEPLGLASPNVQVLDPCCGTGAYLVEVLTRIHRTLLEQAGDDTTYVGSDLRRAATTRIFGFEIMPAPFVIAHLQIAMLLASEGINAPLADSQRAQVFLTNALTGWVPSRHPQSNFGFPALVEERDSAEAVKQADTILVILGNPPYNGFSGIPRMEEERDLNDAYRVPVPGLPPPQGQGVNELYVRFFRIAERRISQNSKHRGIVSFISNYSWLDGLSHPTMRYHLLHNFNSLYIDNLHGDRRISEYAPDGRTSETIFAMQGTSVGIKVGTAVSTFVKTGVTQQEGTLSYRDFEEARAADRRAALLASIDRGEDYTSLALNARLGLPFRPRTSTLLYADWPRLTDLLSATFPGVKTSRDPLVVAIDREELETRIRAYLNPAISLAELEQLLGDPVKSTARYDALRVRETLQSRPIRTYQGAVSSAFKAELQTYAFRPWQIRRYVYRPFDLRWIYWEPETKLLDEKRVETLSDIAPGNLLIEARQRESAEHFCRGSVVHSMPDNFGAGLSTFFPLLTLAETNIGWPEKRKAKDSVFVHVPNLTDQSWQYYEHLGLEEEAEDLSWTNPFLSLFFHALAVVHTPQYRSENAGALLSDWPRIPIPATAELLTDSANLGRRLATLLDPESDLTLAAEWSFLAKLSAPPELPEGTPDRDQRNAARYAITAGWGGAGQGSTVMPRRGDARERDWTTLERDRLTTLAATQSLSLDEALTLLGERCVDLHLNNTSIWSGVPLRVYEYTLGGYQVLKKWLSYRELPLLGRPLREDEVRYFAQVVRRITAILLMGPALDASYANILPTAVGLPPR